MNIIGCKEDETCKADETKFTTQMNYLRVQSRLNQLFDPSNYDKRQYELMLWDKVWNSALKIKPNKISNVNLLSIAKSLHRRSSFTLHYHDFAYYPSLEDMESDKEEVDNEVRIHAINKKRKLIKIDIENERNIMKESQNIASEKKQMESKVKMKQLDDWANADTNNNERAALRLIKDDKAEEGADKCGGLTEKFVRAPVEVEQWSSTSGDSKGQEKVDKRKFSAHKRSATVRPSIFDQTHFDRNFKFGVELLLDETSNGSHSDDAPVPPHAQDLFIDSFCRSYKSEDF
jgi:hypothetical protein